MEAPKPDLSPDLPADAMAGAAEAPPAEAPPADPVDDGGVDRAFSTELGPEVRDFGQTRPLEVVCQWCGSTLPDPEADACPVCGGRLKPLGDLVDVPGLTQIGPEARAAQARVEIARLRDAARRGQIVPTESAVALPSDPEVPPAPPPVLAESEIEAAIRPPDAAVRRLMLELEQDARRAALERDLAPLEIGDDEPDLGAPPPGPSQTDVPPVEDPPAPA